ncbi:hypothetical protein QQ008_07275 [Fulvivirgaceae bacterium BMA10]|uniref:HTH cro/C1-type domain-containing protein n=1 Tax=Splendidivirga corallicola TaxID=3051826 RepID=A0ABT8KKB5_9BACT|nr:hypothetical protein [Fulvivirgaceae bacterium BMA10]
MDKKQQDNTDIGSQRHLDIRFLKIVDTVLKANKLAGVKPSNDSALSSLITSDRSIIAKIRNGSRSCNAILMERLATFFDLDYNCFFRDIDDIYYVPKPVTQPGKKVVKNSAKGATTIQIKRGDMKGNVYSGEIKNNIGKVVNLIPKDVQSKYENLLEDLYGGVTQLGTDLEQRTEDIKKISSDSEKKIRQLQKELEEEKAKKNEITEKYIALLEKKS